MVAFASASLPGLVLSLGKHQKDFGRTENNLVGLNVGQCALGGVLADCRAEFKIRVLEELGGGVTLGREIRIALNLMVGEDTLAVVVVVNLVVEALADLEQGALAVAGLEAVEVGPCVESARLPSRREPQGCSGC